jgi:hypothetical protein
MPQKNISWSDQTKIDFGGQQKQIFKIHHQPPPFIELILKMLSLKNPSKNTPKIQGYNLQILL